MRTEEARTMYSTLLLDYAEETATITFNRPEKTQRYFHDDDRRAANCPRRNRKEARPRCHHHRCWTGLLRGHGFRDSRRHDPTVAAGKPGRFSPHGKALSPCMELSEADDRGSERPRACRGLRNRDTL